MGKTMLGRLISFFRSKVVRGLRLGFSAGLLIWLGAKVDWQALGRTGKNLDGGMVFGAVLLAMAAYVLCAWRWWVLLRAQGVMMRFARAHAVVWVGQFYNAFLPGGVGGDAARLAAAFSDAPDQKVAVTAATLMDRVVGFGVLIVLLPVAIAAGALGNQLEFVSTWPGWIWLGGASVGLLALAGAVGWMRGRWPETWRDAARRVMATPGACWAAVGLSAVVWVLDFVSTWWLARSLGVEVTFGVIALAVTLAYLSTLLPLSLGGHGLREGALVVALQNMGVEGRLTEFALLFLAVTLFCSGVGGVVALRRRK